MKPEEFAFCLACWMPPGVLSRATADWDDRPSGHEIVSLRPESPILTNAADARFDWFVRQFLEHVHVPEELIRFTRYMYPSYVTSEAADWLRDFKFTGEVKFNPDYKPHLPGRTVLAAISAPRCEIRVIQPPIQMLNELLSVKANYWRRVASVAQPRQVHHEPSGEWPFEPWVDLQIARACGFPMIGRAGAISSTLGFQNVRGHISIFGGELPKDDRERAVLELLVAQVPRSRSRGFDLWKAVRNK
jgi:hypothetical protein